MLEMRGRLRLPWGVHARVSLSNSTDGPYVVHGDAIMPFIAAREGRLEILKYLRKQEIQWVSGCATCCDRGGEALGGLTQAGFRSGARSATRPPRGGTSTS